MVRTINAISIISGNLHIMLAKAGLAVSCAWDDLQKEREIASRLHNTDPATNPKLADAQEHYRDCLRRLSGLHQMRFEAEEHGYIVEQQLPLSLVRQG